MRSFLDKQFGKSGGDEKDDEKVPVITQDDPSDLRRPRTQRKTFPTESHGSEYGYRKRKHLKTVADVKSRKVHASLQHNQAATSSQQELPEPVKVLFQRVEREMHSFGKSMDELPPATLRNTTLKGLRDELEARRSSELGEEQQCKRHYYLAILNEALRSYNAAESHYRAAIPDLFREDSYSELYSLDRFYVWFADSFRSHHVDVLRRYLSFAIESRQNLKLAEEILDILPWIISNTSHFAISDLEKRRFAFLSVQLSNEQENPAKASRLLWAMKSVNQTFHDDLNTGLIKREEARILASAPQPNRHALARRAFASAFILSAVIAGAWHRQTLNILYHFGQFLRIQEDQLAACKILEECCIGTLFRFGKHHPEFLRAYRELRLVVGAENAVKAITLFQNMSSEDQSSVAFEHVCLNTAVDILVHVPGIDFHELGQVIAGVPPSEIVPMAVQKYRTLIRCDEEETGYLETRAPRELLSPSKWTWETVLIDMTVILIIRRQSKSDRVKVEFNTAAESLIRRMTSLPVSYLHHGRLKAICRKLSAYGVLHFVPDPTPKPFEDFVIASDAEILGTGTYAIVDSVQVGHKLYARKSVALPRFRQQQVREAIRNEISVMRVLEHPHIVQVFFTYESSSRFYIVMEPLADCDLEAFLVQHSSTPPNDAQQVMVWKWFMCLANTLAFMHSKDIRHKDIKPRNILVKGHDVIFADFGSSHAFLDGGDSTTEGPSYGHTRMYCAPEVIEHQRRNRSADVFSLGCVFMELTVWLVGQPGFDINAWHAYRTVSASGIKTNAYHASGHKISQWFDEQSWRRLFGHVLHVFLLDKMLSEAPEARPSALEVSLKLQTHPLTEWIKVEPCKKCYLGLWIDDKRFPISVFLPPTGDAPPAKKKVPTPEQSNEGTVDLEGLDNLRIRES